MYIHFITLIFVLIIAAILLTLAKLRIFSTSQWINTLFGLLSGIALICQIHLIYQFNHNLFKLALDERQASNINDNENDDDDHNDILSENQKKILEMARKHTVLGGLTIFVLLMAFFEFLIAINVYAQTKNATDPRISYPNYLLIGTYLNSTWYLCLFDITHIISFNIVSLSIYLGFSVNKKYYICICKPLDIGCKKLCESLVECSLDRNIYQHHDRVEMRVLEGTIDFSQHTNERDLTIQTESTF